MSTFELITIRSFLYISIVVTVRHWLHDARIARVEFFIERNAVRRFSYSIWYYSHNSRPPSQITGIKIKKITIKISYFKKGPEWKYRNLENKFFRWDFLFFSLGRLKKAETVFALHSYLHSLTQLSTHHLNKLKIVINPLTTVMAHFWTVFYCYQK